MTPPTQPTFGPGRESAGAVACPLRVGGLFFGYGGLEMGVSAVLDTELAWVSEIDKGACKVIEHRFPGVPNLGDITAIDWTQVEPVDVITGGSPCQDLSHAGRRAGMTEGTRSNLWVAMREAIAVLRPRLVVWENVRGAFSAAADSAMEPCPGCVGDGSATHLRALGRVLGDLSDLGYDAQWHGLRAADVGAPHGRFRVFVVASLADAEGDTRWLVYGDGGDAADADGGLDLASIARSSLGPVEAADGRRASRDRMAALLPSPRTSDTNGAGRHGDGGLDLRTAVAMLPTPQARDWKGAGPADLNRHDPNLSAIVGLLPTPRATDGTKGGPNQRGSSGDLMLPSAVAHLLPTPAVNDMGEGKTVEQWEEWTAKMQAKHGNGNGHGASLSIEAQRHYCDPRPIMGTEYECDCGAVYDSRHDELPNRWGQYADAIHRWESLTRPAPAPTEIGPKGSPRLSARFSEWMMGLPDGWITDVPGITRNEALKLAGNGVVWQQSAAALRLMLRRSLARPAGALVSEVTA